MRIAEVKQEDGSYKTVLVKDGDPDALYRVNNEVANHAWADPENIDQAKAEVLERMIDKLREAAKIDEFWNIKTEEDFRKNAEHNPLKVIHNLTVEELIPQEIKDGKVCVVGKLRMLGFGRYNWDDFNRISKQLDEIFGNT